MQSELRRTAQVSSKIWAEAADVADPMTGLSWQVAGSKATTGIESVVVGVEDRRAASSPVSQCCGCVFCRVLHHWAVPGFALQSSISY